MSDISRTYADSISRLQKKANNMTGSEMQREKEKVAAKMREKQAAGRYFGKYFLAKNLTILQLMRRRPPRVLLVAKRNR
jgi:hypothetical protein